jgi:Tol biopolymer transport system component
VLIPDGTQIFALVGGALHAYDTLSGKGGEVAPGFEQSGAQKSRLSYARDGTIRHFAKSGIELRESIYDIKLGKSDQKSANVTRLDQIGDFNSSSLSPDGTVLVFRANISGRETLQLLSLNSFVLRTIFVSELPGGYPSEYTWSEDSNNLAINEAGSGTVRLVNLKVGTLENKVVLEQSGSGPSFNSPRWSPDKKFISYIQGEKLMIANTDTNESMEALSSMTANSITGWYKN